MNFKSSLCVLLMPFSLI
uniref:Uncharacterized protein n=1 Tax=Anguilla anguilla TaxID=7936 RepID=A0A0E9P931_ANGAN